jgi:hypothetical protein
MELSGLMIRETHNVKLNFANKDHAAVMVSVYAFRPGAEKVPFLLEIGFKKGEIK